MPLTIREECPADIEAIRSVHEQAFRRPDEGRLVDALRTNGGILLSLVAITDAVVAGHLLCSPVSVNGANGPIEGTGLGPIAVLPQYQLRGIGGLLVAECLERLRACECPFVTVLGEPGYYARFGFRPASHQQITCEWPVPDDVFMLLVLDRRLMSSARGIATYRPEFSATL